MRKFLCILLMLNAFNIIVLAQNRGAEAYPSLTFGAEWSFVASVQSGFHHNFFSPEGYRVNLEGNTFRYKRDSDVYVHIGWNIDGSWNLALYAGYASVDEVIKILPVSLRSTRFFGNNPMADRWFTFIDLGSGLTLKRPLQEILAGKLGFGYRISLSRDTKLDFHLAARMTYTHKNIIYDNTMIPFDKINRNNIYVGAVSAGMAVVF